MAKPMPAVEPVTRGRFLRSFKAIGCSLFGESLRPAGKPREPGVEIGLQILDILEPDM